jgi:hypothetical protein
MLATSSAMLLITMTLGLGLIATAVPLNSMAMMMLNTNLLTGAMMSKIYLSDENKEQPRSRPIDHLCATHWPSYIRDAIKTGIESPTPYEVIPYKNGRGIKKIRFIK